MPVRVGHESQVLPQGNAVGMHMPFPGESATLTRFAPPGSWATASVSPRTSSTVHAVREFGRVGV